MATYGTESYETVTDFQGYVEPAFFNEECWYTFNGASYPEPQSETKTYVPYKETFLTKPPSVLRPFPPQGKEILMSPHAAGRTVTSQWIASRPRRYRHWYYHAKWSGNTCCFFAPTTHDGGWTENFSYEELSKSLPEFAAGGDPHGKVDNAISATQSEAWERSLQGVDLLTEIAEARETLALLASSVDAAGWLFWKLKGQHPEAFQKHKSTPAAKLLQFGGKAAKRFAHAWLLLRYAIMPIVYTIQSVNEELGEAEFQYASERSTRNFAFEGAEPEEALYPERYLYRSYHGSIRVRSTVRAAWSGRVQRLLDRTAFNAFATAWELIPLSFVFGWFWDLGNIIRNNTSIDLSTNRIGCTAVKKQFWETVHYVDKSKDTNALTLPQTPCYGAQALEFEYVRDIYAPVFETYSDTYVRTVFRRPPRSPVVDVNLNWQRVVDGIALIINPAMRRFAKLGR